MRYRMSYARTVLAALALAGCVGDDWPDVPTGPAVPPSAPAPPPAPAPSAGVSLLGVVVEASGLCIYGATVRLVDGAAVGDSVVQRLPCGAWDGPGFELKGLAAGVAVTIRASAPGYVAKDVTVVTPQGSWQTATVIELSPE